MTQNGDVFFRPPFLWEGARGLFRRKKNRTTEDLKLEGYTLVARRERPNDSVSGGMAVFAKEKLASRVVLLESAKEDERLWLTMHTDKGPYLLCVWYRPPKPGDCKGIERFREELEQHEALGLGVLVVGDLNVHNLAWLKHSARNSPEGRALQDLCEEVGLQQLVREPTRGEYLLDLVLSDFEGVKCKVERLRVLCKAQTKYSS